MTRSSGGWSAGSFIWRAYWYWFSLLGRLAADWYRLFGGIETTMTASRKELGCKKEKDVEAESSATGLYFKKTGDFP